MKEPLHFRCENVVRMSNSVNAYWLRLLDSERYDECDYGKHLLLKYPDTTNKVQRRNYSIAGRPDKGVIEIAVKRQRDHGVSASIHQSLTQNSMLIAEGVSGGLTSTSLLRYGTVLMVCAGVGVTLPLGLVRGLAALADQGAQVPDVNLIVCVPQLNALLFFTELLALQARHPWLSVATFVTRERVREGISYLTSGRPDPVRLADRMPVPDAIVLCGSSSFVADWECKLLGIFPNAVILDQHQLDSGSTRLPALSPPAIESACKLMLTDSNRVITALRGDTLLQTLEVHGVVIPSQCRMGICGRCSVRLIEGEVESTSEIGLTTIERERGYRLACCSRPVSEVIELEL
ncbi:2Fe-2S iron-sulfur cluster-binding protein [Paraburkholderia azotifigens]|uniref:2Fe-2S iron-sulfur cluster-binding protein n=1 Tax=Paraburkholderia azotifigens TaxID=2057004 RepID=UPI00316F1CD4